ncbi:MAG: RHS repeat-associated core domain-containing protein [Flavobacteriaceae bacterium]|nr:RHS repeat-associated core domain-containing protein [Flavobacteriaceae bacterium]
MIYTDFLNNNSGLNGNGITAGGINFAKQQSWYDKKVEEYIASLGIPPGPPDKKGIYGSPEYTGQPYPDFGSPLNESNEPPLGWPKVPVFNQPGDVPGPPIKWGDPVTNDNVEAGWGYEGTGVIEETDLYFYHPDHLGSTSYVTTRLGKVSQHVEYIPFGEVFLEEKNDKWNTPYKFNSKELDDETGLYYYGARYYDSKVSVWLSVDPLAGYNPIFETEHYIDGQHNGGVYNDKNLNVYGYAYQSPVKWMDPNGKQVVAVHGTWSDSSTWKNQIGHTGIIGAVKKAFGTSSVRVTNFDFNWSGGNYASMREIAAEQLVSYVLNLRKENNMTKNDAITLVGHSHGGNVAIEAINTIARMEEFKDTKINLLTINTPVRPDYQLLDEVKLNVSHVNVYDTKDPVQVNGGNGSTFIPDRPSNFKGTGESGSAGRTFNDATNIPVDNPQGIFGDFHNSHNRVGDWYNKLLRQ